MAQHSYTFTNKTPQFKAKNVLAFDKAIFTMALNIERLSKMQVPHDKGTLQRSGRTVRVGPMQAEIWYGKAPPVDVPYARRWEYENANFKEGRKSRYLRDPADLIVSAKDRYFKEAADSIRL